MLFIQNNKFFKIGVIFSGKYRRIFLPFSHQINDLDRSNLLDFIIFEFRTFQYNELSIDRFSQLNYFELLI